MFSSDIKMYFVTVIAIFVGVGTLIAVGSNDVANAQGAAVGSGAIKFKSALLLAGICEFAGASLIGANVSQTLGDGLITHTSIEDINYAWGMFCSLLATAIWIFIATYFNMPVSSTHSIIGYFFFVFFLFV